MCDACLLFVLLDYHQWFKSSDGGGGTLWDMRPFDCEGMADKAAAAAAATDGDSVASESEADGKVPWIAVDPSQPDLEQVCGGSAWRCVTHSYVSHHAVSSVPARVATPTAG
jgi:hypothetical protein